MHCVRLLGQHLASRDFDRQVAEFQVRVAVLNGFIALDIPVTEAVDESVRGKGSLGHQAICATEPLRAVRCPFTVRLLSWSSAPLIF